jgi:hypothetical protein
MRSSITSRNQGGGKSKAGTGRSVGLYLGAGKARAEIRRILRKIAKSWKQMGNDIDGEEGCDDQDYSGWSVSLSNNGERVAIGATFNDGNGKDSGHVRVFEYDGTDWVKLGGDIDGDAENDQSGWSVSLSDNGTRVAIGAQYNDGNSGTIIDNRGHVKVYEYDGTDWNQIGQEIDGDAAGDRSGWSVSLSRDGTTVAIGAPYNDGNGEESGHVRVFEYK